MATVPHIEFAGVRFNSLAGQGVIVTGGASGIGEAVVRAIVREGGSVVIADLQEERGAQLVTELSGMGLFHRTDVQTFLLGRPEPAEGVRLWAFNQGFYNLFLAVLVVVGAAIVWMSNHRGVGVALVLAGVGAMLGAAVVLALSGASRRTPAIKQGPLPLVAVVLIVVGLAA